MANLVAVQAFLLVEILFWRVFFYHVFDCIEEGTIDAGRQDFSGDGHLKPSDYHCFFSAGLKICQSRKLVKIGGRGELGEHGCAKVECWLSMCLHSA